MRAILSIKSPYEHKISFHLSTTLCSTFLNSSVHIQSQLRSILSGHDSRLETRESRLIIEAIVSDFYVIGIKYFFYTF